MDPKDYVIKINDKKLLKQAFIHRSYLNESKETIESNERLEFLGDAVLELIISEHIFEQFASFPEGKLTLIRSSIVRTETLAKSAQNLGLGKRLFLSRGEEENKGRENPSILANTYEAFLGALYLDQGWNTAKEFVYKTLIPFIPEILEKKSYRDAKSHLQELIQEQLKITPTYKVLTEVGPDHNKLFTVGVFVGNKQIGEGTGKSKQEAEGKAAEKALTTYNLQTEA
ncbi:ribonuclease III [Candidatus Roizmanbacteria bacterium]|nr:ribonuclease III [Candidatus Roizmanbacteria bacterium]